MLHKALWLFGLGMAAPAMAQEVQKLKVDVGGHVQYDLRFRTSETQFGPWYQPYPELDGISRNDLTGKVWANVRLGKFGLKSDIDVTFRAKPRVTSLNQLSDYGAVSPFWIQAHELYAYGYDLFGVPGLDLRVGQQKAMFGMADMFNPTNNVNPNNLEDPLMFGQQLGNLMVRLDYSPAWNWMFTGILVPIFKPGMVPASAVLGQSVERFPFTNDQLRSNLITEAAFGEEAVGYPTVIRDISVDLPAFTAANMQYFFRVGASLGGQDIALSYYNGYSDIPQGSYNLVSQVDGEICEDPSQPEGEGNECFNGLLPNDVIVQYPRMQVAGFNMAGEINPFGWIHKSFKPLGYRAEVAVVFPEERRLTIYQDDLDFGIDQRDGEYEYPGGDNIVVPSTPFAKWTLGLDYTFNRHVYLNAQWVHGFVDEFGAGDWINPGGTYTRAAGVVDEAPYFECLNIDDFSFDGTQCAWEYTRPRIGDYLVLGLDIRFASERALLRVFGIFDMYGVDYTQYDESAGQRVTTHYNMFTAEGFSMSLFPSFAWNFGNGFTLEAGALAMIGKRWTKFGAPENGGTQIWTRSRWRF